MSENLLFSHQKQEVIRIRRLLFDIVLKKQTSIKTKLEIQQYIQQQTLISPEQKKLGAILCAQNAINQNQLEEMLRVQKQLREKSKPIKLGHLFLDEGYISYEQLAQARQQQFYFNYQHLLPFNNSQQESYDRLQNPDSIISIEALLTIPLQEAQKYEILPLQIFNSTLIVASASPLAPENEQALNEKYSYQIETIFEPLPIISQIRDLEYKNVEKILPLEILSTSPSSHFNSFEEMLKELQIEEKVLKRLVLAGEIEVFCFENQIKFKKPELEKPKQEPIPIEYYSFEEVLKELLIEEEELELLVSDGEIRAFRDEDKMKFKKSDIDGLKKGRMTEPTIILPSGAEDSASDDEVLLVEEDTLESLLDIDDIGARSASTTIPAADFEEEPEDLLLDEELSEEEFTFDAEIPTGAIEESEEEAEEEAEEEVLWDTLPDLSDLTTEEIDIDEGGAYGAASEEKFDLEDEDEDAFGMPSDEAFDFDDDGDSDKKIEAKFDGFGSLTEELMADDDIHFEAEFEVPEDLESQDAFMDEEASIPTEPLEEPESFDEVTSSRMRRKAKPQKQEAPLEEKDRLQIPEPMEPLSKKKVSEEKEKAEEEDTFIDEDSGMTIEPLELLESSDEVASVPQKRGGRSAQPRMAPRPMVVAPDDRDLFEIPIRLFVGVVQFVLIPGKLFLRLAESQAELFHEKLKEIIYLLVKGYSVDLDRELYEEPWFSKWLGSDAGQPGALERFVAQSRLLLRAIQFVIGTQFILLAQAVDIVIEFVASYINSIFQAWNVSKTMARAAKRRMSGNEIEEICLDFQTIKGKLSRLFVFPDYDFASEEKPTFELELVLETRHKLAEMKRDLAMLTEKQRKAFVKDQLTDRLKAMLPNPLDLVPAFKDLFLLTFFVKYTREEIEFMYIDLVVSYRKMILLKVQFIEEELENKSREKVFSQQNNDSYFQLLMRDEDLQQCEHHLLYLRKAVPEIDQDLEKLINETRKKIQKLIQLLCSPSQYTNPKKWQRVDLIREETKLLEAKNVHPKFSLELERWLTQEIAKALKQQEKEVSFEEKQLRKKEEKELSQKIDEQRKWDKHFLSKPVFSV